MHKIDFHKHLEEKIQFYLKEKVLEIHHTPLGHPDA